MEAAGDVPQSAILDEFEPMDEGVEIPSSVETVAGAPDI